MQFSFECGTENVKIQYILDCDLYLSQYSIQCTVYNSANSLHELKYSILNPFTDFLPQDQASKQTEIKYLSPENTKGQKFSAGSEWQKLGVNTLTLPFKSILSQSILLVYCMYLTSETYALIFPYMAYVNPLLSNGNH